MAAKRYRYKHVRTGIEGVVDLIDGERPSLRFLDPGVEYTQQGGWHVASCRVLQLVGCGSTPELAKTHLHQIVETHLRGILHRAGGSPEKAIEAFGPGWEVFEEAADEAEMLAAGRGMQVEATLEIQM